MIETGLTWTGPARIPFETRWIDGIMRSDWNKAAVEGDCRALLRLLDDGVDIDARDRYGQTALMLAALHGRSDAVLTLLESGADADVTAKYGLSALMLAVINHHVDAAEQLVAAGADVTLQGTGAPGFFGKTALDLATERKLDALAGKIARATGRDVRQ